MSRGKIFRHLLRYLRDVWPSFLISLVLLLLVAGLTAAKAWIIQPVVDRFLSGASTADDLVVLCALVAGILLSQAILNWSYAVMARRASANVVRLIRNDLFSHLSKLSLGYFVSRPSADLASRVVNDVGAFEAAAVGAIQNLLRDFATVGMLLGVLLIKDWRLALTCLGIILVSGLILRHMSGRIAGLARRVQEVASGLNRQLIEMVGGIEVVLGFGLKERWAERFHNLTRTHCNTQVRATKTNASSVLLVLIVVGVGIPAILFVTGRALLRGDISPGDFGTFLAAMYLMQAPALNISNAVANLTRGMAAVGRAFEIFDASPDVLDPSDPVALPDRQLDLEFRDVSFEYTDGLPVLRDVSFRVEPGELVVIVGDSGSGKSTIAKLLMRFYDPTGGNILISRIGLDQVSRDQLYSQIGYVSQNVFLFDESIEFNLKAGRPDASADEIGEALRLACASDFINEIPGGLDAQVGERGIRISGGQRQRIAIARALISEAKLLVLDEATSALDMDLELQILRNLAQARRTHTIVAISHRLSLANVADRVLVLKSGILVEQGPASALDRQDGEFARLRRAAGATLTTESDLSAEPEPQPVKDHP